MLTTNSNTDIAAFKPELNIISIKMLHIMGIDTTPLTFKARRRLFGCCSDSDSSITESLAELETEDVQRSSEHWNFDFATESPLPAGRYAWEQVRKCDVPEWYTSEDSFHGTSSMYTPSCLPSSTNSVRNEQSTQHMDCACQKHINKSNFKSSSHKLVQTSIKGYAKVQKKRNAKRVISKRKFLKGTSRVANYILHTQSGSASS